MGQSTLMHCSGWIELAKVEAASSAALTTWNESRAKPYINEVTHHSQNHQCVLVMTARKCLGMFIRRLFREVTDSENSHPSPPVTSLFQPVARIPYCLTSLCQSCGYFERVICHPRQIGTRILGEARERHFSSHCQRT